MGVSSAQLGFWHGSFSKLGSCANRLAAIGSEIQKAIAHLGLSTPAGAGKKQ